MICPHCGSPATKVKDTRKNEVGVARTRVCPNCSYKFTTSEHITAQHLQVRQRDGSVHPFARDRLNRSIARADPNSVLSAADLKSHVDHVVELLQLEAPGVPIRSNRIGELVLRQLQSDAVAEVICARYALALLGRSSDRRLFRRLEDLPAWLREEFGDPTVSRPVRTPAHVIKRDGNRETFEPDKLARSIVLAAVGCVIESDLRKLGSRVAFMVQDELKDQALVTSGQIASEALKELLKQNKLAYIRYASAVKGYQSVNDFWLDIHPLIED